jgi:hypothetical protein
MGLPTRIRAALLAASAVVLAAAPAAADPPPGAQGHLEPTVAYLEQSQNADGGFGDGAAQPSDPQVSAWVALALGATGVNPLDQRRGSGQSAFGYLASQSGELQLVPDFERALLVADAAGTGAHDFGGLDLVASLLADALPDGSFPYRAGEATPDVNDTSFAILALSPLPGEAAEQSVARAAAWLLEAQNGDGSWPSTCPRTVAHCRQDGADPPGEIDATAAAVEALRAAGVHDPPAESRALAWLRAAQLIDGGLPEYPAEDEANVASTAWAAQALWAAGVSPEAWPAQGGDPLSYMASMQQADGSIAWRAGQISEPVWMTAYVVPAFAGRALPILDVPREAAPSHPAPPPQQSLSAAPGATPPAPARPGAHRGRSAGVAAGGGGAGAPLFRRPAPQSTGTTPGAPRRVVPQAGERTATGRPATVVEQARAAGSGSGARRLVSGLLLGAAGRAAPGLAGAAARDPGRTGGAIAIVLGALGALLFVAGAVHERRRGEAVL